MDITPAIEDDTSGSLFETLNTTSAGASISLRTEYEERLLTFHASSYYAKPPCLSPLFCARFGWQNADKDMLVCSSCSSALAITLNSKLSPKTYDSLCHAYRNKIVSCHATSCPFRLSSSQQLKTLEAAQGEFDRAEKESEEGNREQSRLVIPAYMGRVLPEDFVRLCEHPNPSNLLRQNAKKLSDLLQSISARASSSTCMNLDQAISSSLSWRFPSLEIPSKIREMNSASELARVLGCDDESILALSLLGWNPIPKVDLEESAPVVSLGCPCCLSILDIQLERTDRTEDEDTNEGDRFSKRQRMSSRKINPLDAHRHYCPYQVGFPENATNKNPVWNNILERLRSVTREGKIEKPMINDAMPPDIEVLENSANNVRRILSAGIATR